MVTFSCWLLGTMGPIAAVRPIHQLVTQLLIILHSLTSRSFGQLHNEYRCVHRVSKKKRHWYCTL